MKITLIIATLFLSLTCLYARQPYRTADDIARKQTDMMVRELHIIDTMVIDTLFRMNLKYALLREKSNTRADALEYIQLINAELKQILTAEQYQQFMSQQVNHAPHRPHSPCYRIISQQSESALPQQEATDTLTYSSEPPPADLL
jgi:hypothetical protein